MTTGVICTAPILQFTLNNGQLAAGGYIAPTVGGVPTAVYQDSGLTTPLPLVAIPNQSVTGVPLNSRGEISNAAGASCQLFLTPNIVYVLTLFDSAGNQIWSAPYVNGIQVTGELIAPSLSAVTDTPVLASLVRSAGEIAAGVTPTNYAYEPGNIRRYGAVVDGSADDSGAIRIALNVAGQNCTPVTCFPPGQIKVGSTVYIPQNPTFGHIPMVLSFKGCVLIGQGLGTGTIFESGTGVSSSATNFGQPIESATSLHYATIIEGALFQACSAAIRLYNFVYGCEVRDVRFENVSIPIYALRCFASRYTNCDAQVTTVGAGVYQYQFDQLNNAIVVQGCSAAGGGSNTTGIGFGFTGAGAGITFEGNTAEHLDKGLLLGAIQGMSIRQNYFEALTTLGIDATSASNKQMDVDQNWFNGVATVINAQLWIAGKFGAANDILGSGGLVNISDINSFCTVEIAGQVFTEATANAAAVKVPASYTLGPSVTVLAPREIYQAASGFSVPIAVDATYGRLNVPAFAYSGGPAGNGASYFLPFVTQTNISGSSTLDSQITDNLVRMAVIFDLSGDIGGGGSIQLSGLVFGNNIVFRCDANTAAWTVTASSNAGNLRLTIGGTGLSGKTMTGWNGQIRHM